MPLLTGRVLTASKMERYGDVVAAAHALISTFKKRQRVLVEYMREIAVEISNRT